MYPFTTYPVSYTHLNAAIPEGSAKEQAAWKLVTWLTSAEVQRIRLETGAAFPSRKGVTSDQLEPLAQTRALFYGAYGGTYVLDNVLDAKVYTAVSYTHLDVYKRQAIQSIRNLLLICVREPRETRAVQDGLSRKAPTIFTYSTEYIALSSLARILVGNADAKGVLPVKL